jgi:hypothetical protein
MVAAVVALALSRYICWPVRVPHTTGGLAKELVAAVPPVIVSIEAVQTPAVEGCCSTTSVKSKRMWQISELPVTVFVHVVVVAAVYAVLVE